MTQFAKVNALTYTVTNVIEADQEFVDTLPDSDYWIASDTAMIGDTYNAETGVFIYPQPYSSWTLNTSTNEWEPPLPKSDDGNLYRWDEDAYQADNLTGWVIVE